MLALLSLDRRTSPSGSENNRRPSQKDLVISLRTVTSVIHLYLVEFQSPYYVDYGSTAYDIGQLTFQHPPSHVLVFEA
jgi:hypothetical protein